MKAKYELSKQEVDKVRKEISNMKSDLGCAMSDVECTMPDSGTVATLTALMKSLTNIETVFNESE